MSAWKAVGAACHVIGVGAVVLMVAGALSLAVPRVIGFEPYAVMSGSMEPEIQTGALAYVRPCRGEDLADGDVAAFYDDIGNVVIHRVMSNRIVEGELVTKGDANGSPDMNPVSYDAVIGSVGMSVPGLGVASELYSGFGGRLWAFLIAACGAALNAIGSRISRYGDEDRQIDSEYC